MFTTSFFILMYVILGCGYVVINILSVDIDHVIKIASDALDGRHFPKEVSSVIITICIIASYLIIGILWPYYIIKDNINSIKNKINKYHLIKMKNFGMTTLMNAGYDITSIIINLDDRTVEFRFTGGNSILDPSTKDLFGTAIWPLIDMNEKYKLSTLYFTHDCGEYYEKAYACNESLKVNDDIYEVASYKEDK